MNNNIILKIIRQELEKDNLFYPFIGDLNRREKVVLNLREQGKSLQFVGERFEITRERVRQIEEKAKTKLKCQKKIMVRLAERISEYVFMENEIEVAFNEYLVGSDRSPAGKKLRFLEFSKVLWESKGRTNKYD